MGALSKLGQGLKHAAEGAATSPPVAHVKSAVAATPVLADTVNVIKSSFDQANEMMARSLGPSRDMLKGFGLTEMVDTMDAIDTETQRRVGARLTAVHEALSPFRKPGKDQYNADDMAHIVDLIENPTAAPKTGAHAASAERLREMLDDIGIQAEEIGLPVYAGARYEVLRDRYIAQGMSPKDASRAAGKQARRPFQRRENYWPHYFPETTVIKYLTDGKLHQATIAEILERRLANSNDEAKSLLRRMLRAPGEFRGGPLQHARTNLDLTGYDKDIVAVLTRYFMTAEKRLLTAKAFGASDERAMQMIKNMASEKLTSRKAAHNVFRAWAGEVDAEYRDLAKATSTFHTMTMLSTAGIVQPSQLNNTAAVIGWGNTLNAMSKVAREWRKSKMAATNMGAIVDNIHGDFVGNDFKSLSQTWTRLIGQQALDKYNRTVSAIGGQMWAQQLVDKISSGGENPARWASTFKQMGINLDDVLTRGVDKAPGTRGRALLNEDELARAGLYVANNSQFRSGVLDLPEFRNSTAGQFLYLFKSFALQQTDFINKHLITPYRDHNDIRPIMRYMAGLIGGGIAIGSVVRMLKGRETPEDQKIRVLEDMALAGGFGAYFDAFRAMANGPQSVFAYIAGPTASEAAQTLGSDLPALAEGVAREGTPDFEPMLKHFVSRLPLAGQYLRNTVFDDDR